MSQYMVPVLRCRDCQKEWAGDTDRDNCCYCGSKNLDRRYVDQGGAWESDPKVKAYEDYIRSCG